MQTRPLQICLICGFCSSMQDFAYSFLQIPPHDGHPCCSANGSHYQAHSGLSPPSYCPYRANIKRQPVLKNWLPFSVQPRSALLANFFPTPHLQGQLQVMKQNGRQRCVLAKSPQVPVFLACIYLFFPGTWSERGTLAAKRGDLVSPPPTAGPLLHLVFSP